MPTPTVNVVILGAGYAGMMALCRLLPSKARMTITLVDEKSSFEQRIRLHEAVAGQRVDHLDLRWTLARSGVSFVQGRVEALDRVHHTLTVEQAGQQRTLDYDHLIYSPGSQMAPPELPGARHLLRVNSLAQAARIHEQLRNQQHITVLGGGLTGIELASELAERFPAKQISMVTAGAPSEPFSKTAASHLKATLDHLGVQVLTGRRVIGVEPGRLLLDEGQTLPHDSCLWAGGFSVPPLAREAGLEVDEQGRVVTDAILRSVSDPDIFVAGDAARVEDSRGQPFRMGCVNAMPQGARAGANLRALVEGRPLIRYSMGYIFRCLSLGRANGLIQFTDGLDNPGKRVWVNRQAVLTKELVCRMTFSAVKWELWSGLPLYRWRRAPACLTGPKDGWKVSDDVQQP